MTRDFVTFYYPGLIVAESSSSPIDGWDVQAARALAPLEAYGFRFTTRERGENDLDSHVSKTSGMYYLGGRIETLPEVKARATDKDRILISNMEGNRYGRIVHTWCGWVQPFEKGDTVLS